LGDDWPIGYDDIKPYYDQIDRFIGLYGSNEGTAQSSRRHLHAAAQAALPRALGQESIGQAEHHMHSGAFVRDDEGAARQAGVSLLRRMQSRLLGEGELLEPRRAHRAGASRRES
jgi:choline dehydrogenase-like flavoprotein